MTKQLMAEQMASYILVDTKTHFKSRFARFVVVLLRRQDATDRNIDTPQSLETQVKAKRPSRVELKMEHNLTNRVFAGEWENIPDSLSRQLKAVLPRNIEKNVWYDLKKNPSEYIRSTMKMCREAGEEWNVCFLPTRRNNIPCHLKFDTEAIAQIMLSNKEKVKMRSEAVDRETFNDAVWRLAIKKDLLEKKLERKAFRFHHEISTDGVSASSLFSKSSCVRKTGTHGSTVRHPGNSYPSRNVGVDPRKKNILTAVDTNRLTLKYTSCQRSFESCLTRFHAVLRKEKEKKKVLELECGLSSYTRKTNCPDKYAEYLREKARVDDMTKEFYQDEKWRNWKFRMFCSRKRSF